MDYDVIEHRSRRRETVRKTLTYFFLSLWALIVLFPFYWMILSSLKSYSAYNSEYIPKFYTLTPTLQNYRDAFTAVPLGRYFTNTLIFTLATTAIMLVVILFAAFAFARLDFPGKSSRAKAKAAKRITTSMRAVVTRVKISVFRK